MSNYVLTKEGKMYTIGDDELYHYGVPGMKWGVRKNRYVTAVQAQKNASKAANEARKKSIAESRATDSGIGSLHRANRKALNAKRKAYGESIAKDRAHNKQLKVEKRLSRDMRDLENITKKASTAIQRDMDFMNNHRVGNIQIYDRKLRAKAAKYSRDVDVAVLKLSKRYDRVSAVPEKDTKTGKMYVDITINDKTSRVDAE